MKHTPGPWRVDGHAIRDANGVLKLASASYGQQACSMRIEAEERQANLQLMAAGPDLLDALKEYDDLHFALVDACKFAEQAGRDVTALKQGLFAAMDLRRAAIAKAEGREP